MQRSLIATLVLAAAAAPLSAQVAWDSPALISPAVPSGFSIFFTNPAGGDIGALGTFRHDAGPVGLGFRAGIADESGSDGAAVWGGIDVSGVLARGVENSEIDVVWWGGGGVGVGQETLFTAPLGVIIGWTGSGGDILLSPYGGAHVVLDLSSIEGESVRFDGVIDLGVDLVLSSGWMIRFGASLADRESIALGVRLPGGGGS